MGVKDLNPKESQTSINITWHDERTSNGKLGASSCELQKVSTFRWVKSAHGL
jgi:hypothetical protein